MTSDRVPSDDLLRAGLDLMAQYGKPLQRIKASGRSMIYETPDRRTVRVRTSNDHLLIVLADSTDPDKARVNIEGTDQVLIVMPQRQRTPGPVIGYLIPTDVVAEAAKSAYKEWLATNPNTKGENRTWNLWFDDHGPACSNNFAEKWRQYRLPGIASVNGSDSEPEFVAKGSGPSMKLSDVIASAKRQIADAAGVPVEQVKVNIEV